jgi:hypothetical protein
MRAGIGAEVEICHTAGDMRAERAECGSMGLGRSCGGEGDMRADGARRDRGEIARGYTGDMMPTMRRYDAADSYRAQGSYSCPPGLLFLF